MKTFAFVLRGFYQDAAAVTAVALASATTGVQGEMGRKWEKAPPPQLQLQPLVLTWSPLCVFIS